MLLSETHRFMAFATATCWPDSFAVPQSPSIRIWLDFGSGGVAETGKSARARGEPSNARAENFAVWRRNRLRLHSPPPPPLHPVIHSGSLATPCPLVILLQGRSFESYRPPLIALSLEHNCYRPMRFFRIGQRAPYEATFAGGCQS